MLCASVSGCTREPSETQLKISALERVREELAIRLREYEGRAHELRDRLSGRVGEDSEARETLLRQRLVVEHRLTATRDEFAEVTRELERLKCYLWPREIETRDSASTSSSVASQSSANLDLFFQHSATKKPLWTSPRPYSMDYIRRPSMSRSHEADSATSHSRSRSFTEDHPPRRLPGKAGKRAGLISSPPLLESGPRSRKSYSPSDDVPLPVDEFNNSFSSRVIDPSSSRPRPRSCLRPLQIPAQDQRNLFAGFSRRSSVDAGDFGNATLLPVPAPRSTAELLDELPSTPLPSYVHTLIREFEQVSHPRLALSFMHVGIPDTPVVRKQTPLTPVMEECSPISSVKSKPSPMAAGRKLLRKQRPIFTLRLPSNPSSQSSPSLLASSSTSVDASSEEQSPPTPLIDFPAPPRRKGLPSTRNHDLAMLGTAPDDIPETPVLSNSKAVTVKNNTTARPMSVLRRVKSRLVQLGRR